MPAVTIGGTEYPGRLEAEHEPLTRDGLTVGKTIVTAQAGSATERRVFSADFGLLTNSELTALRAALKAPGAVTLGGDLVGSPSISARASQIEWASGDLADQFTLTCLLTEVSP